MAVLSVRETSSLRKTEDVIGLRNRETGGDLAIPSVVHNIHPPVTLGTGATRGFQLSNDV
jgi:hypothetical protein